MQADFYYSLSDIKKRKRITSDGNGDYKINLSKDSQKNWILKRSKISGHKIIIFDVMNIHTNRKIRWKTNPAIVRTHYVSEDRLKSILTTKYNDESYLSIMKEATYHIRSLLPDEFKDLRFVPWFYANDKSDTLICRHVLDPADRSISNGQRIEFISKFFIIVSLNNNDVRVALPCKRSVDLELSKPEPPKKQVLGVNQFNIKF